MAFKLSTEAMQDILGQRDYTLAYNQELSRLHKELEQLNDSDTTNMLRGEIKMLRKVMNLHGKAMQQMEEEYSRRQRNSS